MSHDEKKIYVYNTFRPVIPIWEVLNSAFPDTFYFVAVEKLYRGNTKEQLPGKFFTAHLNKRITGVLYLLKVSFVIIKGGKKSHLFFTQPPLLFVVAYLVKLLRGDKYVIHFMDVYPEIFENIFHQKPWVSFFFSPIKWLSKLAIKRAEKVVVIGECMKKVLMNKGIAENKIFLFPNFSGQESDIIPKVDNKDYIHIVYAGNIGFGHDLRTIIRTITRFRNTIKLTVIGKGAGLLESKQFAEQINASNVEWLTGIPDAEFFQIVGSADFHFINLRKEFTGLMVPSKYYSSIKLGIPVIYEGQSWSEVYIDVTKNELGFAFQNEDETALEAFFHQVLRGEKKFNREDIRKYYFERYEIFPRLEKYRQVLVESLD